MIIIYWAHSKLSYAYFVTDVTKLPVLVKELTFTAEVPVFTAPTTIYTDLNGVLAAIAFVICNKFTASVLFVPATKSVIFYVFIETFPWASGILFNVVPIAI